MDESYEPVIKFEFNNLINVVMKKYLNTKDNTIVLNN